MKPLALAYYMKEDLHRIWQQSGKDEAACILSSWIERAEGSGIRVLQKVGRTLRKYRRGILNWYDFQLTTSALEGMNTKIKLMQRMSYEIRDKEFLRLKIYACKELRYSIVG